jgi:hypothetical protein
MVDAQEKNTASWLLRGSILAPSSRCWLSSTWRIAPGPTRPGRSSRPADHWPSSRP